MYITIFWSFIFKTPSVSLLISQNLLTVHKICFFIARILYFTSFQRIFCNFFEIKINFLKVFEFQQKFRQFGLCFSEYSSVCHRMLTATHRSSRAWFRISADRRSQLADWVASKRYRASVHRRAIRDTSSSRSDSSTRVGNPMMLRSDTLSSRTTTCDAPCAADRGMGSPMESHTVTNSSRITVPLPFTLLTIVIL